jgi:hypothetical protein
VRENCPSNQRAAFTVLHRLALAGGRLNGGDEGNEILHLMDRVLGTIVADWGQPGHQGGQFTYLHSVAIDSKGKVFTGETINGRRVQKFTHVECNDGNGMGNGYGNCS